MAYENLKAAIKQAIKNNNNQEITGDLLQSTLLNIVNTIGADYKFLGFATSSTVPPTSEEGRLLYFTTGHRDSYMNFPTSTSGTYITLEYGIYALTREANSKYWKSDAIIPITQELGSALDKIMSQKVVSDAIKANADAVKANADAVKFSKLGSHPHELAEVTDYWLQLDDSTVEIGKVYNFKVGVYTASHKPFINIVEYVSAKDTISFSRNLNNNVDAIKYFIVIDPSTHVIKEKIEITANFNSFTVSTNGILVGSLYNIYDEEIHIDKNYNSSRNTNLYLFKAIKANADAIKAINANNNIQELMSVFNKIIFIGDSVTAGQCIISGFESKLLSQYSYPSIMSRNYGFTAINIAKSGIKTHEFNSSRFSLFESNKENADACFIELGWNDENWGASQQELDEDFSTNVLQYGEDYNQYKTENSTIANYCQLLKKVLASRPNIIVFLVISFGMAFYRNDRTTTIYGIKKVANWASNDVILLDMSDSELKPDAGDEVHFTPIGYAKKASYLANAINNLNKNEQLKISKKLLKL